MTTTKADKSKKCLSLVVAAGSCHVRGTLPTLNTWVLLVELRVKNIIAQGDKNAVNCFQQHKITEIFRARAS